MKQQLFADLYLVIENGSWWNIQLKWINGIAKQLNLSHFKELVLSHRTVVSFHWLVRFCVFIRWLEACIFAKNKLSLVLYILHFIVIYDILHFVVKTASTCEIFWRSACWSNKCLSSLLILSVLSKSIMIDAIAVV